MYIIMLYVSSRWRKRMENRLLWRTIHNTHFNITLRHDNGLPTKLASPSFNYIYSIFIKLFRGGIRTHAPAKFLRSG